MAHETLLLLFLTRNWVQRGECAWALREPNGRLARRGRGRLKDLPRADSVVGIASCDLVLLHKTKIPGGKNARDPDTLAWALEDTLLSDPEANHVTFLGGDGKGEATLGAVPKPWLQASIEALAAVDLTLDALIPEQFLAPFEPNEWTLVLGAEGGFIRTDEHNAIAVDVVADGRPPATLSLMMAQSLEGTQQPNMVHLLTAPDTLLPDLEAWQNELGVPVKTEGRWDWAAWLLPLHRNLLKVDKDTRKETRRLGPLFRPAGILAAALIGVHLLGTVAQWLAGSHERSRIQDTMATLFRESFPQATAVVDPPLQMRRNLALMRRAAGETGPDDLVALLGATSRPLAELPPGSLKSVQYTTGRLTLDISVPEEQLNALRDKLSSSGLQAQVEPGGPATGGKPRLVVRARG